MQSAARHGNADARARLLDYLEKGDRNPSPAPGSTLKRIGKRLVPARYRSSVAVVLTDALRLRNRRRADAFGRCSPLRLHLGSAHAPKADWVNLDLIGFPVDIVWNVERTLPFPDSAVDAVFHEHLLEHLTLPSGLRLMEDCFRVLKPKGVLRIGVPDASAYARSYVLADDRFLETIRPNRPSRLLALQEVFYRFGHKTMYDFETLELVCRAAGFEEVEQCVFGDSRIAPCPDSPHRRPETLYVEAVK